MAPFRIALASAFLLSSGGWSFSAETPRPDAAPDGRGAVQVGPATGEPDDAAAGLVRDAGGGCSLVPRFSQEATLMGPSTGDPEKDSFGFRVVGHEGCPSGAIR